MTTADSRPPAAPNAPPAHGAGAPVAGSQVGGGRHTTGSIAAALHAELIGPSTIAITGIDGIDTAGPGVLTFIRSRKFAMRWASSAAPAAIVTRGIDVPGHNPAARTLLVVDDADVAAIAMLRLFAPPAPRYLPGIHPTALVDPSATLGQGVHIGPGCVVGPDCTIGDGSVLVANVHLGAEAVIGPLTTLHPGVVILDRCEIGTGCILWPSVVIGADGFGYIPAPDKRGLLKIPHIGNVVIEDGVEIGAGSCIDRGKFGTTRIGMGTKIDNLVQIGHNAQIGRCCIICGMTGVAGSVIMEDGVTVAGHVGIADGLRVGRGAKIAAKAGVLTDVPAGETWFGTPAGPHKDQMRSFAALRKLSDHLRKLKRIEQAALSNGLITEKDVASDDAE
ncbi:MAG: UDP-3-O-(3-hydroxymyristoyl)glucosamine N-acyltransferase [Phycisphaerales bacterium]